MKRSTDRILTTHVGSLVRPPGLVELMRAKESGQAYDREQLAHTTNLVEHPELIAWRITTYARLLGRENVMAGSDCGFSQGAFTPRVHSSIMWAKLQALAEGAALASQQLWSRRGG